MTKRKTLVAGLSLLTAAALCWGQAAPQSLKAENLVGKWDVEISVDSQYYYMTLVLELVEGSLSGKISEPNGMFTDVPCQNFKIEGRQLTCETNIPTPPDGAVRPWTIAVEVEGEAFTGSISNAELQISAFMTGKLAKK
ncbi:MAG: hypothetical protein OEW05_12125 [Candidatus Aminicenantes bacterium]|nr:hypothetical protein [Candidatus Aminicenantes bacterium]